jgi:hypothetical protein
LAWGLAHEEVGSGVLRGEVREADLARAHEQFYTQRTPAAQAPAKSSFAACQIQLRYGGFAREEAQSAKPTSRSALSGKYLHPTIVGRAARGEQCR